MNLDDITRELTADTLKNSLRKTLGWFQNSGVMRPADGSWGVAERILMKQDNPTLEKTMAGFPPWTQHQDHLVFEQRRADCCFQTAFLFLLAADTLKRPELVQTTRNLLDYLFCRSGLRDLNTSPDYPFAGAWNWSNAQRFHSYYLDDNSWVCTLMLLIAEREPNLDREFNLIHWAMPLAKAMATEFPAYLKGEKSEQTIAGDMKWRGNPVKPHWCSLLVMALAKAYEHEPNPLFRNVADLIQDFLLEHEDNYNTSEWSYAVLGAAFARHAFHDDKSEQVMTRFGDRLAQATSPEGLIPSQHEMEAPAGDNLADLIYTINWAALAFQALTVFKPQDYAVPFSKVMRLLLDIQDTSPQPYLNGCWRGLFDQDRKTWGGGNRIEGGAACIYTGWTNAPIAWSVIGCLTGKSLEQMGQN